MLVTKRSSSSSGHQLGNCIEVIVASGKPMAVFFGGFNLVGSRAGLKRYYKLISALDFWSRNGSAVKAAIVGSAAIMKYGLFSFSLFLQQRKKKELYCHYSFLYIFFFLKKKMHFITHLPIQTIAPQKISIKHISYGRLNFYIIEIPHLAIFRPSSLFHENYNFLALLMKIFLRFR